MPKRRPTYITEEEVESLLTWPAVFEVSEEALRSVCKENDDTKPKGIQPQRTFVEMKRRAALTFSMLGYIDNYRMKSVEPDTVFDSLGHKLATVFFNNNKLDPPQPIIMSTVFLFDTVSGQMKSIIEGDGITAWRTAGSSMVGTKYLYFDRNEQQKGDKHLAILGCGVQGRIHAIGMCTMFPISEVHLWNRSTPRAEELKKELEGMTAKFNDKNLKVFVHGTVRDCVKTADIVVTASQATSPILFDDMLKENVHINAVGASKDHHSEIDLQLYQNSKLYVDSWTGAKNELKGLNCPVEGEVGEIINKSKALTKHPRTIFHSLGMAVTDVAVAQLADTLYRKKM